MKTNRLLFILFCFISYTSTRAQDIYKDSIRSFQEKYVTDHEVVKGNDKKSIHFFPIDVHYKVTAKVERIYEADWFKVETSGKEKQVYRVYAILHFSIKDTSLKLPVYQSQRLMDTKEYADYLFLPFTDLTNGEESYENGRYIDLKMADLETGSYVIDFNKAYNPYCAYVSNQFNCPIPPKENNLAVAIRAGEMKFGKVH
ncbi:MAG TPA: DUF1684 domain-containing protein [Chitinophagaceae bacterium]